MKRLKFNNKFHLTKKVTEGIPIEVKVKQLLAEGKTVDETTVPYYPDKEYGVVPETDIRCDRHEVLRQAIDDAQNRYYAAHEERLANKFNPKPIEPVTTTEPTATTNPPQGS